MVDFYEEFSSPDWGSRRGVTFRSGYHRQRLTFDPTDEGHTRPASEDPANQIPPEGPTLIGGPAERPTEEPTGLQIPPGVLKLYGK